MGILKHFARALHDIERSPWISESPTGTWMLEAERELRPEKWSAWDGPFSQDQFREFLKGFVEQLFCRDLPEGVRWGFKEIRYSQLREVKLLLELYPDARILLLLRHPADICASHVSAMLTKPTCENCAEPTYKTVRRMAMDAVRPFFLMAAELQQFFPGVSVPVYFEDLVETPYATMDAIRDFLELEQAFDPDKIDQVMSYDLVSQRKSRSRDEMDELRRLAHIILGHEVAWYENARTGTVP